MTVFPFSAVQMVRTHPKIFVSRGTHGHYLTAWVHTLAPFTGGVDLASGSCGEVEKLDDVIAGDIVIPGDPGYAPSDGVALAKGLYPVIGWIWAALEASVTRFGSNDTLVTPTVPSMDVTGTSPFDKIIRPDGLKFPEVGLATSVVDWMVAPFTAPAPDLRDYDFVVDRPNQVWWTPRGSSPILSSIEGRGWSGRWGPRVTNDPHNRRAGMKCPDFLLMFLEGVAVAMNK